MEQKRPDRATALLGRLNAFLDFYVLWPPGTLGISDTTEINELFVDVADFLDSLRYKDNDWYKPSPSA